MLEVCPTHDVDVVEAAEQPHKRLMKVGVVPGYRLHHYASLTLSVLKLSVPGDSATMSLPMTAVDAANHARDPPLLVGSPFSQHCNLIPPPQIVSPVAADDELTEVIQTLTPQILPYSTVVFHGKEQDPNAR